MAGADSTAAPVSPLAISFTTRDLVLILFRHRQRFLATLALGVLAAIVISVGTQPLYQSDASVLINKLGREFTFRSELSTGAAPIIPMTTDPDEILNTQVQLLRSRDVVMTVINRIGLERLYPDLIRPGETPDLDRIVDRFQDHLSAVPLRTSNIINLWFRHRDPQVAMEVLDTLIQTFRKKSIDVYINTQTQFYADQVEQARRRFAEADGHLAQFRSRRGVMAFDQQRALMLQQRLAFDTDLKKAQAELAAGASRIQSLQDQIARTPDTVTSFVDTQPNRVVDDARTRLLNLKLRQQEIAGSFAPDSRQAQQAAQEIATAERFLAEQSGKFSGTVRKARNEVVTVLEQELSRALADQSAVEGRQRILAAQLTAIDAEIAAMSGWETERWTLEREVAVAQENLKIFMTRLEEARVADSLNKSRVGDIAVVQAPTLPDLRQPVRPRPVLNILLGLLAGLFGAFVVALLSELMSDTIYDPVRSERALNLPILAVFDLADGRKG